MRGSGSKTSLPHLLSRLPDVIEEDEKNAFKRSSDDPSNTLKYLMWSKMTSLKR